MHINNLLFELSTRRPSFPEMQSVSFCLKFYVLMSYDMTRFLFSWMFICTHLTLFLCRFTKEGVLVEGLFWKDVEKLIDDYNSERKSK
jgi:hypothetical protein